MGALKLGLVAGLAYTFGGNLGVAAIGAVKPDASIEAKMGAAWAARVTMFALGIALASRI